MDVSDGHHACFGGRQRSLNLRAGRNLRLHAEQRRDELKAVSNAVINFAQENAALFRERLKAISCRSDFGLCIFLSFADPLGLDRSIDRHHKKGEKFSLTP